MMVYDAATGCSCCHANPHVHLIKLLIVLPASCCFLSSIEFPVRQATTGRLGKDKAAFVARGENLNRPGTNLQSPGVS
jgi:hypothetical protein